MSIIAKFVPVTEKEGAFRGLILGYPHEIIMEPNPKAGTMTVNNKEAPDSLLFTVLRDGECYELGFCRKGVAKNGEEYMNVVLNNLGPMYPEVIFMQLHHSTRELGTMFGTHEKETERVIKRSRYEQKKAVGAAYQAM